MTHLYFNFNFRDCLTDIAPTLSLEQPQLVLIGVPVGKLNNIRADVEVLSPPAVSSTRESSPSLNFKVYCSR